MNDPQAGSTIIVLDALDECTASEFVNLVQNIEDQFRSSKLCHGKVNYLLTSRPYEQIVSEFHNLLDFSHASASQEKKSQTGSV